MTATEREASQSGDRILFTRLQLANELGLPLSTITLITDEAYATNPECFDLSDGVTRFDENARKLIEENCPPPQDWISDQSVADVSGTDRVRVRTITERYIASEEKLRGQAGNRRVEGAAEATLFMSPELAQLVGESIAKQKERVNKREKPSVADQFNNFAEEMHTGETVDAKEFKKLVEIFGPESCVDLLFQYRPEFKGLPVDMVSSFLTDYLGVFLIERGRLDLDNLSLTTEFLSNESLKSSLIEVVKQHCHSYYQQEKRNNPQQDDLLIISNHLEHLKHKITDMESKELLEVLEAVDDYYTFLFVEIDKPENFVETLTGDRPFPDLNQRINVGELVYKDAARGVEPKRQMLYADEPGMGKSASAIMAKEHVGARCALILSPSGMVSTWEKYLSDRIDENGKQLGYFKTGCAPRVLAVESPDDLVGVQCDDYDYIILTHGRLKPNYTALLKETGFDMLIVDEAHEFKNIEEGQKANELILLSDFVAEQEDSYTLLLTATPAPNKVSDIAMTLRLLHPGLFVNHETGEPLSNHEITMQIIKGDYIDLRTLLVPRMQRKLIEESINMPGLKERYIQLELSKAMEDIYDLYLEDDELTSSEKIQRIRQLLNNPATHEATPDVPSVKAVAVGKHLRERFKHEDKILMFVNDYVDNIITGEHTIHDALGLPKNVKIETLTGDTKEKQREAVRQDFQQSDEKTLLIVSGNIAGLGVDLSAADRVVFYNEPWNESLRRQQIGRAYRPGRKAPLYVDNFYFPGTLEEGMMLYSKAKDIAIKKLLSGIKLSELEQAALMNEEANAQAHESIFDINAELAAYYYSSWQRMLRMFGHVKEIGEEKFTAEFLPDHGVEYAKTYRELANRSYQANVARLNGGLIANYFDTKKDTNSQNFAILDIASGPELLRSHLPEEYADSVVSLDANIFHFIEDKTSVGQWRKDRQKARDENRVHLHTNLLSGEDVAPSRTGVAKMLDLPIRNDSVDYINMALALHYTRQVIKQGVHERVQAIHEINRVLKPGGRATITMIYSLDFEDETKMKESFKELGFKIIERDSGEVEAGDGFKARVVTVQKVKDSVGKSAEGAALGIKSLSSARLQQLGAGLKIRKTEARVRDTRKIVDEFWIKGQQRLKVRLNQRDQAVLDEETSVLSKMNDLRSAYGTTRSIPSDQVVLSGFSRIFTGKKHVLFARLKTAVGVIALR